MARAVRDAPQKRAISAGEREQTLRHLDVLVLVTAADVVDLAGTALQQDELDARAMILDEEPVAHLAAVAVKRQRLAVECVRHEQRDELLRVLVRPVRVRPARDRSVHTERPHVGGNEQLARRLGGAVRARRIQQVVLQRRSPALEVSVDLVGRNLHEPRAGLANVLEQHLRAAKLRSSEIVGRKDRTVDVSLGCEVDDRIAAAAGACDLVGCGDIALVELDAVGKVRAVAGVRELVEHDDLVAASQQPLDEMRADEACATCDENAHARRLM